MSMKLVDGALQYFSKYREKLGSFIACEMEESIMRANNSEKLDFLLAILGELLSSPNLVPEDIAIGGLRLVADPGASFLPYCVFSRDALPALQLKAIRDMEQCYSKFFAKYCNPESLHGDSKYTAEWNSLCFMWWEILPRHGVPYEKHLQIIDIAILDALKTILQIENLACKESALHGLSHWYHAYPDEVSAILATSVHTIPAELRDYASQIVRNDS